MHFSEGQIAFVIFFVTVFAIALVWAYKKDRPTNRKYYTGTWKVFVTIVLVFSAVSFILRHIHFH